MFRPHVLRADELCLMKEVKELLRTYEALYIANPEMEEADIQAVAETVEKLVTDNGGAIVRSEIWGKRKLAYVVKKFTEGHYILLRFDAEPDLIKKLEAHFRLSESIFRFLIVHLDAHTLRLEAEQLRRNQEQLEASRRREEERAANGGRRDDDDDDDDDDDRPRRRSSSARSSHHDDD